MAAVNDVVKEESTGKKKNIILIEKKKNGNKYRQTFYCKLCKKTFKIHGGQYQRSINSHEKTKQHRMNMIRDNLATVPKDHYFCGICNTLKEENEKDHVSGEKHQKRVKGQQKYIKRRLRYNEHKRTRAMNDPLDGKRTIPIKSTGVSRVRFLTIGCPHDHCAPEELDRARRCDTVKNTGIRYEAFEDAGVYFNTEDDLLTPEEIQRASEAWDARIEAYQIDTQWGRMPGGGAFEGSNFYYADDEYAFDRYADDWY